MTFLSHDYGEKTSPWENAFRGSYEFEMVSGSIPL